MGLKQKVFGVIVFTLVSLCMFAIAHAAAEGESVFTKANIWYEDTGKPILINYHVGTMIPVGTKVKIDAMGKDTIKFTTGSGVTLTFQNAKKYSTITLQELFDRYFSKESVVKGWGGVYGKFNGKEKDNVKKGTIAEGMSKEAVAMAYGYPPSHRTAALTSDEWAYWDNRYASFRVVFKDNRVSAIERSAPRRGRK
jgi:hypothetical protein